jgi:hypothetical protein
VGPGVTLHGLEARKVLPVSGFEFRSPALKHTDTGIAAPYRNAIFM